MGKVIMAKIPELVIQHRDELEKLAKKDDATGLRNFAIQHGLGSRSCFFHYKKALITELNIYYDKLQGGLTRQKIKALKEKVTHHITLYSDGYHKGNRFGITNCEGIPVWYGEFYKGSKNQANAEIQAAMKAVYLAGKVAERNNLQAIGLTLFVDAKWLCYANAIFEPKAYRGKKPGSHARILGVNALKKNVLLNVNHVYSEMNPADAPSRGTRYCHHNDKLHKIPFDEPES